MPAAKLRPVLPKHHHPPAGHILAAVIAHAFDHRLHAAVAHAETLAGHAADIGLAAGRAVKGHVADDDVFFRRKGRSLPADKR